MSQDDIEASLLDILSTSDLNTATVNSILNSLQDKLKITIDTAQRSQCKTIIHEYYASLHSNQDEVEQTSDTESNEDLEVNEIEEEEVDSAKKRGNGSFNKSLQLSNELSEFMESSTASRPEVVKKLWIYFKEHQLQNPKDKREILLDDKLERVFKRKKITMFSMNKFLSPMMKNIDELQSSSESEARPHKLSYKRKKQIKEAQLQSKIVSNKLKEQDKLKKVKKTKKLKTSDKDDNIIKKKSGIHKPCRLSNALAEFVGSTEESRPQIVSKLWDYIKQHGLQNPNDKREILFDEKLKSIFQQNSATIFSINKCLSAHIFKIEQ